MRTEIIRPVFLFFLFFSHLLFAQHKGVQFTRINVKDGLPHSEVRSMFQDSRGFMWLGTWGGLARFDGYKYVVYKANPDDSSSIGNSYIFDISEDSRGSIWASTYSGLSRLDRKKNTFTTFYIDEKIQTSKPTNTILRSRFDSKGQLWSLIVDKGIHRFNPETETFEEISFSANASNAPYNIYTSAYDVNESGSVWIASSENEKGIGLYRYDVRTKSVTPYLSVFDTKAGETPKRLTCLMEDSRGDVWIGFRSGLARLEVKTGKVVHYSPTGKPSEMTKESVEALEEDEQGMIWIGTSGGGLLKLDPQTGTFVQFRNNPNDKASISSNNIYSLFNDHQGTLWIGTDKGLNLLPLNKKIFQNYLYSDEEDRIGRENQILDLFTDSADIVWFCTPKGLYSLDGSSKPVLKNAGNYDEFVQDASGTFWLVGNGGLWTYDPTTDEAKRFGSGEGKYEDFNTSDIWSLYKDPTETLWMGTGGYGLYGLDLKTGNLRHFAHNARDSNSITSDEIGPIFRDRDELWIGPYKGGLNCINLTTGRVSRYNSDPKNPRTLSHNVVSAIFKDREGRLWIGTSDGLNILSKDRKEFLRIEEKDGLASNVIKVNGISSDRNGNVWVATNAGISKIHPRDLFIRNYDHRDGFQKNPEATTYQNKEGKIFFFGQNGFTCFQPEEIEDNHLPPKISITDFLLFNKSLTPGENSPLKEEISEAEEITLTYKEDFFTIEFAAHNYLLAEKNQYAYQLEGFEDWTYCGTRRLAYYTNIPPGNYVFRVKASNNDGIWNEEGKTLNITITPPFWQTSWFRFFAVGFVIVSLYGLYRWRTRQLFLQRKKLEKMVHERTKEVEAQKEELSTIAEHLKLSNREITLKNKKILKQSSKLKMIDQLKSQFLANISHEFRTPLTLILVPLEEMIAKLSGNASAKSQLSVINRNAQRLLQLINQLLDLSKIENGTLPLDRVCSDFVTHLRSIVFSFNYLAQKHSISYCFSCKEEEIVTSFDPDKIEKIFSNLIANAFKYTPDGGEITVHVGLSESQKGTEKKFVRVDVKDSGKGISQDHLPHIFDRFYQGEPSTVRRMAGTGIGLALTKELVELHRGKIKVTSDSRSGSCFTVYLPVLENEQGTMPTSGHLPKGENRMKNDEERILLPEKRPLHPTNKNAPLLLIIEDNEDLRQLVKGIFSGHYRVAEAADGVEGWEMAIKKLPDLIISDVMMPGKDGLTLCSQLKNDPSTSHIPTILLSARSNAEEEGLTLGADDYIIKPFKTNVLALKVKNLLDTRKRMWESICKELGLQPVNSTKTPGALNLHDREFIEKATEIALNHLTDVKFEMETLYRELGMSRTLVYKKMKSLTGLGPNEFIRHIRLNKAAQLLREEHLNVTDVMYRVGFSHRSYFVNCFRQQFGQLPSEYSCR